MAENLAQDQDTNSIKKIAVIEPKNDSMIHDAQYDYYGKRLATGAADGQITIYDVSKPEKSQKLVTFQAHNGPIWQVTWGHPRFGNILASCSFDKKVAIWKEVKQNEWQEIISHREHSGSGKKNYLYNSYNLVNGIAWAPWECGLQLAACGSDGFVSILTRKSIKQFLFIETKDDDTWEKVFTFEAHEMGVNAITWASLSNLEDFSADQLNTDYKFQCKLATASCDCTVKIWKYNQQTKECQQIQQFKEHKEWVRDVSWNPSIGATFDIVASCSEDQTVVIYKLDRKNQALISQKILQFDGPVWHVSWSLQGNMLAISSASQNSDNVCKVYSENPQGDWDLVKSIDTAEEQQQI